MPVLTIVIVLIVAGVLLWLVNTYIPMQRTIKNILNAVIVIIIVIWLLKVFGLLNGLQNLRIWFYCSSSRSYYDNQKWVYKPDLRYPFLFLHFHAGFYSLIMYFVFSWEWFFCAQKNVSPLISVISRTFISASSKWSVTVLFVIYLLVLISIILNIIFRNGILDEIPFSTRSNCPEILFWGL